MMHKNVAYNGLRFFLLSSELVERGFRVVETRSAMCTELHISEGGFFLIQKYALYEGYKNN